MLQKHLPGLGTEDKAGRSVLWALQRQDNPAHHRKQRHEEAEQHCFLFKNKSPVPFGVTRLPILLFRLFIRTLESLGFLLGLSPGPSGHHSPETPSDLKGSASSRRPPLLSVGRGVERALWQITLWCLPRKFQTARLRGHFWERLELRSDQVLSLGLESGAFSASDAVLSLWFSL